MVNADNRHDLVSDFRLTEAGGMAEGDVALDMLIQIQGSRRLVVGADRGYDSRDFVAEWRDPNITPHVAQKKRWSATDGRTTYHESYRASQKVRKRVESIFRWMKTVGGSCRSWYRGVERTGLYGELVATAYNLVRMSRWSSLGEVCLNDTSWGDCGGIRGLLRAEKTENEDRHAASVSATRPTNPFFRTLLVIRSGIAIDSVRSVAGVYRFPSVSNATPSGTVAGQFHDLSHISSRAVRCHFDL